jgi:hypothetical protein
MNVLERTAVPRGRAGLPQIEVLRISAFVSALTSARICFDVC